MSNDMLLIWSIIEGPFSSQDVEDWDQEEDGPDCWIIVAQTETSYGSLEVKEIYFETFDGAYELVKYFTHGRAPYVIEGWS